MCRSSLFERAGTDLQKPADDEEGCQMSAKLHCLFGIPSSNTGRRILSTHAHARSKIYDLRNYTDKTQWGPFRDDGSMRVDWEMIESQMIILGYNSGLCCPRFLPRFLPPWTKPLQGVVPRKARMMPEYPPKLLYEPDVPLILKDPYMVSGVWARVCLDISMLLKAELVLTTFIRSCASSITTTCITSTSTRTPCESHQTSRALH
jgi:hypothetical protein